MTKEDILTRIRSGEGELRPIIDHYASNGQVTELAAYLDDREVRTTLLYILSELPTVPPILVNKIRLSLRENALSGRDEIWAKEIVDSHV